MTQAKPPEDLVPMICRAVRLAVGEVVREELAALLSESGGLRDVLRSELAAALPAGCCRSHVPSANGGSWRAARVADDYSDIDWDVDKDVHEEHPTAEKTKDYHLNQAVNEHFSDFLGSVAGAGKTTHHGAAIMQINPDVRQLPGSSVLLRMHELYVWLMRFEEPERTGCLASIVTSASFEFAVSAVIFLHCPFMVLAADSAVKDPRSDAGTGEIAGEWFFQIFYSTELVLKLFVHRLYFFWCHNWRLNTFDLLLVIQGFFHLLLDTSSGGTFLRILRLVKLGKALRTVKAMAQLRHLRAILVCLQGSFTSFFWSLVMLASVFFLFSLFFVQVTAAYLADSGETAEGDLEVFFGSVSSSMLTLYKTSTGGDDWSRAYDVISQVDVTGSVMYLIFIAFVHFALINIITGIFVESAMQTLIPDREAAALANENQESEDASDLEHYCKLVDSDFSGKLTPEQFEDGMQQGRIPTLLLLLGLSKHHVLRFFRTMSELASDDGGQVDIKHFVAGCMRLKGPATNFDLQLLHAEVKCVQFAQERAFASIQDELCKLRALQPKPDRGAPHFGTNGARALKNGICKTSRRSDEFVQ